MAKRKRLTPARAGFQTPATPPSPQVAPSRPPIAQVAGEAAAVSALSSLSGEWDAARAEGRLVISIPLEQVVADHLVRDRVALDDEALNELKQSLISRGQQTPIEVRDLPGGGYGLISGWRRLTALTALHKETGEARFAHIQALIRRPDDLAASYVAMVEENEIRADLSFYERARIVLKALEAGAYQTEKDALQGLFSAASYARRSKIKSFLSVVRALDGALRFPERMSERTGLAVVKILSEEGAADRLRAALAEAPPEDAEAEAALLLSAGQGAKKPRNRVETDAGNGGAGGAEPGEVRVDYLPGRMTLTGTGVTPEFRRRLKDWLRRELGREMQGLSQAKDL